MISVLLTAFREPMTIGKAIDAFLPQISKKDEILVAAPDKETKEVILRYGKKHSQVKYLQDPGRGKPAALNILFKKAKGDILILSDGDVHVSDNAVNELLRQFNNKNIGAISGRPISTNSRESMLGYWSHLLSDKAHDLRLNLVKNEKFIVCSGYLYAIRKGIVKRIPEESLSDDAVISYLIFNRGYSIGYAPKAEVYIKYPTNFSDWIKQKKRSTGGYNQLKYLGISQNQKMRGFSQEISGFFDVFRYARNLKEFIWTISLVFARAYMWALIFFEVNIQRKKLKKVWVRIESTK